jgi:Spore germination protein gerPA/gerPF
LTLNKDDIYIGEVTGGVVNFGGAVNISPISVEKTVSGSGGGNTGQQITTNSGFSSTNAKCESE